MRLALTDKVTHCWGRYQHLTCGHPACPAQAGQELLSDDAFQSGSNLHTDLFLLVGWEHVDHPVDRLGTVLRVQGREDEVTCLSCGQRYLYGLQVAKLADEDDIRVLTQGRPQRRAEPLGVAADLSLVHHTLLVLVQELDRVFNGDYVLGPGLVYLVDQGCQ